MEKQKYTYADFKDKTIEGIRSEVSKGLASIAFHFYTQYGMPKDVFSDLCDEKFKNGLQPILFYMNCRNRHPEWFK